MRTAVAATAPVESGVPVAVTQSPTARLVAAAGCVVVKVVDELRATVRLLLAGAVVDVVPPVADVPKRPRALEETEVTLPLAKLVGVPVRAGTLPEVPAPVPVPLPEPGRPPPPGRVVVHVPDVEGWLTLTLRAVSVPPDDVPVTTTQSPAATDDAETVVDWEKVVDEVQLTVTCPAWALWTSMAAPDRDATDPDAPGNAPVPAAGADPEVLGGVVVADVVEPPPPQAASRAASEIPAAR